ncbi:S1 RNA-binding domain-containing protein [Streptococcus pneumoniae]|nr:S1 RNA-binding domain-containing protein [Streptococcus pneumoniae]
MLARLCSMIPTISNLVSTHIILFENLFKLRQLPSATSKQYFELTSSVLSTTSKQCFEQPVASFLVCALIFIEYKGKYSELK